MYIQFLYLYGGSMKKRKKFNPELYNKMEIPVAASRQFKHLHVMYTQCLNNLQYAFIQPVSQTSKNYYPFASNLIKNCTSFNFQ